MASKYKLTSNDFIQHLNKLENDIQHLRTVNEILMDQMNLTPCQLATTALVEYHKSKVKKLGLTFISEETGVPYSILSKISSMIKNDGVPYKNYIKAIKELNDHGTGIKFEPAIDYGRLRRTYGLSEWLLKKLSK